MNILLNGNLKEIAKDSNLSSLVLNFCKNPKNIIVELNGHIVPSDQWPATPIKEKDVVELVGFVGGG